VTVAIGPGVVFGGYRIEAVVGRGGMGVVYRATDLSLSRPVALKLIAPEFAQDPAFRKRFLREPRLAASLDHPGVVPIYEAGEREGQLYLAMRWVEGSDLRQMLQRAGRLPPEATVDVLTQVAEALDATHRRGLVHRDVKPANILVDDDGHAYLGDFGISERGGGAAGAGGRMAGTLDYLAPEQIRGEDVDGRTDSFALGCVLYECLSGAPPFRRKTEAEALWAHLRDPPPPLRAYPALDPVIARALAKERDDRYPGCEEMMRAAAGALGVAGAPTGRRLSPAALLILGGSVLLATVSAVALVSSRGGGEQGQRSPALDVATNSVAAVGTHDARVELAVPLPGRPTDVALSNGTAWVSTVDSTSVTGVSARTRSITRTVPLAGRADAVAAGAGSVWVADGRRGVVSRIRLGYEHVTQRIRFRPSPHAVNPVGRLRGSRASLAVGADMVWLANGTRQVMRIDPRSGRLTLIAAPVRIDAVAAGGGRIWAVGSRAATVFRIDSGAGKLGARAALGGGDGPAAQFPIAIAATGLGVWVLDGNSGTVTRLDPGTLEVAATTPLPIDRVPSDIAANGRTAWVSNGDGSLSRLDAGAADPDSVRIGESLERVAADANTVWVTTTAFDQKLPGGAG
jgi:protein kinase-like protein